MTHDPFSPGIQLPNLIGVIPTWVDQAACGGKVNPAQDPDDFYPISIVGRRRDARPDPNEAAKTVCKGCDVREKCLTWALEMDERHGVWGGLSPEERQELIRGGVA